MKANSLLPAPPLALHWVIAGGSQSHTAVGNEPGTFHPASSAAAALSSRTIRVCIRNLPSVSLGIVEGAGN